MGDGTARNPGPLGRLPVTILVAAAVQLLVALSYPLWDIPECGTGNYALAPLGWLLLILLSALVTSGVAAGVIGASVTVLKALAATIILVVMVSLASTIGAMVGVPLAGCDFNRSEADSILTLAVMASLAGAVPGYLIGLVIRFLSRPGRAS